MAKKAIGLESVGQGTGLFFMTRTTIIYYTIWFEVAMTTFMSSLSLTMTLTFLTYILFLSFDACW